MTDTSNQSENRTLQAVAERTTQNEGPHPAPKTPDFTAPAGACDTHCHVFGPGEVFPYAEGRHFFSAKNRRNLGLIGLAITQRLAPIVAKS